MPVAMVTMGPIIICCAIMIQTKRMSNGSALGVPACVAQKADRLAWVMISMTIVLLEGPFVVVVIAAVGLVGSVNPSS